MSLKIFHIFFVSIVLCLSIFLVIYGFREGATLLLIFGGLLFLLLIPYLYWFRKKMAKLSLLILPVLFSASDLLACPVCFGDPNSLMVQGTKIGILFLISLVLAVLSGIVVVGTAWYLRSKKVTQ